MRLTALPNCGRGYHLGGRQLAGEQVNDAPGCMMHDNIGTHVLVNFEKCTRAVELDARGEEFRT